VQEPNLGDITGMAAKIRISEKMGITINSVENFKRKAGWRGGEPFEETL
jgi:hypothetical protein